MGPDVLLTVRGRKSGLPRTTPVTICEYGLRRGFISPFGETQWVRNLRAAGRASVRLGSRREIQQESRRQAHDENRPQQESHSNVHAVPPFAQA